MEITAPKITRSKWSSEKAFIYATAAAAVGLGNIWRFPYIVGENGGAAFIIAYLIAVIALGIPLMILEISAGKIERGSPVKTFRAVHRRAGAFGWLIVGLTMMIMSYYLVITGWSMGYAIDSLSGNVRDFAVFTDSLEPLLYFGLVALITAFVVAKGVKLIEVTARLLMPILIVTILGITAYSLTLDGTREAMSFLFDPDFTALTSPALWVLAFGQAFFSLAVGQGYLITYGSFLPDHVNIPRAAGTVAGIETGVALIAGLMIFPFVFTFGLNPAEGSELAFSTLPIAFGEIPLGAIVGAVFFWLLFLAALSSCIAGMEVVKTAMREELRLTHNWATVAAFLPILPLGILAAISFTPVEFQVLGRPFLEVLDIFAANQTVVFLGIVGGALFSWLVPRHEIVNKFKNHHRKLASKTVTFIRYAWIGVLGILLISFLI